MSTELDTSINVAIDNNPVIVQGEGALSVDSSAASVDACVQQKESVVEGYKKEYSIVGDGLYASVSADDAPQWLVSIIDEVVGSGLSNGLLDLEEARNSILAALDEVETAKNQYQELINIEATIDGILASRLTTLNATLDQARADIVSLDATKVGPEEALAIAADKIAAELNEGAIKAQIDRIDSAYAGLNSAYTTSIETLEAVWESQDEQISGIANAQETLYSFVGYVDEDGQPTGSGLLADVQILQKQNDGVIETITGTYDVMFGIEDPNNDLDNDQLNTSAEPYATWKAQDDTNGNEDVRLSHIGDVYIKYSETANGAKEYIASYKFIKSAVDTTSPYATDEEGFTWALVKDQAAQAAFEQALNAYDLADSKRRVFTVTPVAPYDEGDLWVDRSGSYKVIKQSNTTRSSGYDLSDWEIADQQTSNFVDSVYTPTIDSLKEQIDAKIEYFYYDNPTNNPLNSISSGWNNAQHGNVVYYKDTYEGYWYNSSLSNFEQLTDTSMLKALKEAETAQSTADGKMAVYFAKQDATNPGSGKFVYWYNNGVLKKVSDNSTVTGDVGDELKVAVYTNEGTADEYVDYYIYTWSESGQWALMTENGVVAKSGWAVDIDAYLKDGQGEYGANSQLGTQITTKSNGTVETAFEYSANTKAVGGQYHNAGFGLYTTSGNGTISNPYESEFWINADRFRFTNTAGGYLDGGSVFSIDGNNVVFNGKVSFGTGQVGSIDEAIASSVDQVAVGDKNINITDNLIPTTSLITDINNAGYQFIGDPIKSSAAGIGTFAEPQINLDSDDEVYSPYIDEVPYAYYYRFGIYGVSDLSNFYVVSIDASDNVSYNQVDVNLVSGQSVSAGSWYIVDGIINPPGSAGGVSGRILTTNSTTVAAIDNFTMPNGSSKVLLGWVGPCIISRMKLAKITADTFTNSVATLDYVNEQISNIDVSGQLPQTIDGGTSVPSGVSPVGSIWRQGGLSTDTGGYTIPLGQYVHYISNGDGTWNKAGGTYIDGSSVITGSIDANRINVNDLLARDIVVNNGKITAGNGSMVLDFLNGSIYIA